MERSWHSLHAPGRGARLIPGLSLRVGQTIAGKYRVERLLGSSAATVVVAARNILVRERVVLKLFASYGDGQDGLVRGCLAKAELASHLRSAHVARIVDIGATDDGLPYIATQFLEGDTLEAELAERGRLEFAEAARWALQACEGLAEAHAAGLVHGDLKPRNVLLAHPPRGRASSAEQAEEEDPRVVTLMDFGSTSPLEALGDHATSAAFAPPAFLAPEQIQTPDQVDARADIWALGGIVYAMVSGAPPFEAESVSGVLVAVVRDTPALLTDAPYELARLVSRCLDKDPARRPTDVAALAAALSPFAGPDGPRLAASVRATLEAAPSAPRSADTAGSVPALTVSRDDATEEARAAPFAQPDLHAQPAERGWRAAIVGLAASVGAAALVALALSFESAPPAAKPAAVADGPPPSILGEPARSEPLGLPLAPLPDADDSAEPPFGPPRAPPAPTRAPWAARAATPLPPPSPRFASHLPAGLPSTRDGRGP